MTPTNLLEAIQRRCGSADPIVHSEARAWRADDLLRTQAGLPTLALKRGGRVVLWLNDPEKLLLALVALDGRANQVLLLSPRMPMTDADALLTLFEPDVILADTAVTGASGERVMDWPADISALGNAGPVATAGIVTSWVFATSGTTGPPKLVEQNFASLSRTIAARTDASEMMRWGEMFELTRFAGIQVLLQAIVGLGMLILPDVQLSLSRQLAFLSHHRCNALSATPSLWRKILMMPDRPDLSLRQVTLGGEIADGALLGRLRREYPDARITHVYASTEAGAAFGVHDGRAGFPAHFLERPPKGIALKVENDRLFIQNGHVRGQYLGSEDRFCDDEGFVDTGDVVAFDGDRVLFLGRANGAINIGGNKLFPEQLENHLLGHPEIRQARIFAKPSPIMGQVVIAEVVPREANVDHKQLTARLLAHCQSRFPRWQIPAILKVVDDVAISAAGKIERAAK